MIGTITADNRRSAPVYHSADSRPERQADQRWTPKSFNLTIGNGFALLYNALYIVEFPESKKNTLDSSTGDGKNKLEILKNLIKLTVVEFLKFSLKIPVPKKKDGASN